MPLMDMSSQSIARSPDAYVFAQRLFLTLSAKRLGGWMMIAEKSAILRRQSMELLKELTEILARLSARVTSRALSDCVRQYALYMKVDEKVKAEARPLADSPELFINHAAAPADGATHGRLPHPSQPEFFPYLRFIQLA
jgi:hypothetical protein